MEKLGIKSNLEILVTWGYHCIQQHNLNSLFAIEPSIRGMANQVTCAAYRRSVLSRINYDSCIQDVLIRRWPQQRRLLARDVTRGNQYWRTAIGWYISCILSQLFHLKKYQEKKKSKNPSYLALEYLPQRQWMNYTTNRTLCLQSIYWRPRGKLI